jgi:hypothetical protein
MNRPLLPGDLVLDARGRLWKVLVIEPDAIGAHVRLYAGNYPDVAAARATMKAGVREVLVGHVPTRMPGSFLPWILPAPEPSACALVASVEVTDDELEGYREFVEGNARSDDAAADREDALLSARFRRALDRETRAGARRRRVRRIRGRSRASAIDIR